MQELPDPTSVGDGERVTVSNATFVREGGYWKPTLDGNNQFQYDEVNLQPSGSYFMARRGALWYILDDQGRVRSSGYDNIQGMDAPFTATRGGHTYQLTETADGFFIPADVEACEQEYQNNREGIPRQVRNAYHRKLGARTGQNI